VDSLAVASRGKRAAAEEKGVRNPFLESGKQRRDASGKVFYYFADHLGSSRVVTNATGTVCYEADFYPYGGERAVTTTCSQSYKFTGKERDTETGNDNFGARYYPNNLGRFLTPDPLMASGHVSNPQTWNRYSYALNNPLRITDPEGLYPSPAYNCDKNHKECLDDAQRLVLENSTITDESGKKISGEALWDALNEKQKNAFVNITRSSCVDQVLQWLHRPRRDSEHQ
jgi:RHS repeat-associated protein